MSAARSLHEGGLAESAHGAVLEFCREQVVMRYGSLIARTVLWIPDPKVVIDGGIRSGRSSGSRGISTLYMD